MGFADLFGPPSINKLLRKRDVAGLVKATSSSDWMRCRDAAVALGEAGGPEAISALIPLLSYAGGPSPLDNSRVRMAAATALGALRAKDAVPALVGLLSDTGGIIITRAIAEQLVAQDQRFRQRLIPLLASSSPWYNLMDETPRGRAVVALGNIGDVRAVPPLLTCLLSDRADDIRRCAAVALGRIQSPDAVPALITAARTDAHAVVREVAEEALRLITPDASSAVTKGISSAAPQSDYSAFSSAVIYCATNFDVSTLRLSGFTGQAEVVRAGSRVEKAELVAALLLKGCDKDCILVSSPDYGVGFVK
jgi:HEAT repeat protein